MHPIGIGKRFWAEWEWKWRPTGMDGKDRPSPLQLQAAHREKAGGRCINVFFSFDISFHFLFDDSAFFPSRKFEVNCINL
jgi:hypothetical protein